MSQIYLDDTTSGEQFFGPPEQGQSEREPGTLGTQMHEQKYWTTAEAANILGKSERTIRRLLQTGALNGYKEQSANGMVWRVEPVESETCNVSQHVVNDLINEYQRREEQIESLNKRIEDLEDQITKTSALYKKAMQDLAEYEKRTAPDTEKTNQPDIKTNWWHLFRLPASLRTVNVSELI